ncbi:GSCFA family protein [compost metagenome]
MLRVAAERACREFTDTFYFPSFEIITGAFNGGAYFAEDLRSVRAEGVHHVMSLFLKHGTTANAEEARRIQEEHDVLCAEEFLDVPDAARSVA